MSLAFFIFHGNLNDFLPACRRSAWIEVPFEGAPSLKHAIESLGVPHPEVLRIVVNDHPQSFSAPLQDGDRVNVFPFDSANTGSDNLDGLSHEGETPRFVLDNHLGKLAAYLRMLGFDARYQNDFQDEELADIARREKRILLTRDRRLLMRNMVEYGYCLRSLLPREQVIEIIRRYHLDTATKPFQRCVRCNELLQPVSKEAVLHRLQPLTREFFFEFSICPNCQRIYWKGSHFQRMVRFLRQVTGNEAV